MTTCLGAQSKEKVSPQKSLVKERMNGDSQRFLPALCCATSTTRREKQIPVGGICSELSFVRNRNYFPYADFWPGIISG